VLAELRRDKTPVFEFFVRLALGGLVHDAMVHGAILAFLVGIEFDTAIGAHSIDSTVERVVALARRKFGDVDRCRREIIVERRGC
jgi:hypothetical protein